MPQPLSTANNLIETYYTLVTCLKMAVIVFLPHGFDEVRNLINITH